MPLNFQESLNEFFTFYYLIPHHIEDFMSYYTGLSEKEHESNMKPFRRKLSKKRQNDIEWVDQNLKVYFDINNIGQRNAFMDKMCNKTKSPFASKYNFVLGNKYRRDLFLAEMMLLYLVSNIESFNKDLFGTIYRHNQKMLKTDQQVSYKEILEFKSTISLF